MSGQDVIDERRLRQALAGQEMGRVIEWRAEIGSTNDRARELADLGHPHGSVVVAEEQTAGRGRRGAAWCGVPGRDLMVSVLLRAPAGAVLSRITLVAALALARSISGHSGLVPRMKWPNDLWLQQKKLAGVLSESCGAAVVLGIGCNINSVSVERPAGVAGLAVSLREAAGQERWWDRTTLLVALLRQLQELWPAVIDPVGLDPALCLATGPSASRQAAVATTSPWHRVLGQLAELSLFESGRWLEVEINGLRTTLRMEGLGHEGQLWVCDGEGRRQALFQVDRIRPLQ